MKRLAAVLIIVSSFLAGSCCNSSQSENSEVRDNLILQYMTFVSDFYDSAMVDWDSFAELNIHQYKSDWDPELHKKFDPSWEQTEAASSYWEKLQNAKFYLHCQSLPLRAMSNRRITKAMDELEAAFDEVFVSMVSQEYYMRVFEDVFDETVPPKIDHLAKVFANN